MKITPDIIKRLQCWDNKIWRHFLDEYGGAAFNLINQILRNAQETEDCCADLYQDFPRKLASYEFNRKLKPWFHKTAYRQAIAHLRKRVSAEKREIEYIDGSDMSEDKAQPGPESSVYRKELYQIFLEVRHALSDDPQATAFFLKRRDGLDDKGIAFLLGIAENSVRSYVSTGRVRVEAKLVELYPEFRKDQR